MSSQALLFRLIIVWLTYVCLSNSAFTALLPNHRQNQQNRATVLIFPHQALIVDSNDNASVNPTLDLNPIIKERLTPLSEAETHQSRRDWLLHSTRNFLGAAGSWMFGATFSPLSALADNALEKDVESSSSSASSSQKSDSATTASTADAPAPAFPPVEMKNFVDPMGMFVLQVPKRFYAIRRTQSDLPDAKGQGRRGSSIFTAGDLSKAEVISIEHFPIQGLLEENGIVVSSMGVLDDLSTFPNIGKPNAVATLINRHRERSRPGQSISVVVPNSWSVSPNGKELEFTVKAEIEVQKPELLLEQYGVSRLFRITVAKASLESNDGNVTAVFCSALEKDYEGPDGEALRTAARSFRALEQTTGVATS